MRALTIVNLCLWCVLFTGWVPYSLASGWNDPVSLEVRWILSVTAALLLLLAALRVRVRRPVLG